MGSAALLLAVVAALPSPGPIHSVRVELLSRDRVRLILYTDAIPPAVNHDLRTHRALLGDVLVPLSGRPTLTASETGTAVIADLDLATIPEAALSVDFAKAPVRWEGLSERGQVLAAVAGTMDAFDRSRLQLPGQQAYDTYVRVGPVDVAPSGLAVTVRMLINLYNPLGFDVVARGLDYRLTLGGGELLRGHRPGVRLRSRQGSDVLIEEDIPLTDLASGALGALMGGQTIGFAGTLVLVTPNGDRFIPLTTD